MNREEDLAAEEVLTILLYASDRTTRQNVRLALGRKVATDLPPVRVLEVATQAAVLTAMDAGGIDLAILDGEAVPGGMGLSRQLKDEVLRCPPILLLIGRPDDAWLATWSRAMEPSRIRLIRSDSLPLWLHTAPSDVNRDRGRASHPVS